MFGVGIQQGIVLIIGVENSQKIGIEIRQITLLATNCDELEIIKKNSIFTVLNDDL
jgi:hypothetical protein